ncbi:hypothetical protein Dimus_015589 [Dionaea muscipula]
MKIKGLEVEAVDVIYIFRLEHKFSPMRICLSFLRKLKEECNEVRKEAAASPFLLNKANQKQLDGLKSVVNCLEEHKVDPAKLLPGWQLKDQILRFENEIANWAKRKPDDADIPRDSEIQVAKRPRTAGEVSSSTPSKFNGLVEPDIPRRLSDTASTVKSNDYPATSWHHEYAASFPENAVGTEMRTDRFSAGVSTGSGSAPPSASGGRVVDNYETRISEDRWIRDTVMAQSPSLHTSLRSHSLLGPSSSIQRFPGLPNESSVGVTDLYQFADAVTECDFAGLSRDRSTRLAPSSSLHSFLY